MKGVSCDHVKREGVKLDVESRANAYTGNSCRSMRILETNGDIGDGIGYTATSKALYFCTLWRNRMPTLPFGADYNLGKNVPTVV